VTYVSQLEVSLISNTISSGNGGPFLGPMSLAIRYTPSGIHNHCFVLLATATDFLLIRRQGRYSGLARHITAAAATLNITTPTAIDTVVMRYIHITSQTKSKSKGSLPHQTVVASAGSTPASRAGIHFRHPSSSAKNPDLNQWRPSGENRRR